MKVATLLFVVVAIVLGAVVVYAAAEGEAEEAQELAIRGTIVSYSEPQVGQSSKAGLLRMDDGLVVRFISCDPPIFQMGVLVEIVYVGGQIKSITGLPTAVTEAEGAE